jgi:hypothetical protein
MLKRVLSAAILAASIQGSWLGVPSFAQDQNGQSMQSEKKMGETMMKDNEQQTMKGDKNANRMSKKKKKNVRRKSKKNQNMMKSADANRM